MFVLVVLEKKEGIEGNINAGYCITNIDRHTTPRGKDSIEMKLSGLVP